MFPRKPLLAICLSLSLISSNVSAGIDTFLSDPMFLLVLGVALNLNAPPSVIPIPTGGGDSDSEESEEEVPVQVTRRNQRISFLTSRNESIAFSYEGFLELLQEYPHLKRLFRGMQIKAGAVIQTQIPRHILDALKLMTLPERTLDNFFRNASLRTLGFYLAAADELRILDLFMRIAEAFVIKATQDPSQIVELEGLFTNVLSEAFEHMLASTRSDQILGILASVLPDQIQLDNLSVFLHSLANEKFMSFHQFVELLIAKKANQNSEKDSAKLYRKSVEERIKAHYLLGSNGRMRYYLQSKEVPESVVPLIQQLGELDAQIRDLLRSFFTDQSLTLEDLLQEEMVLDFLLEDAEALVTNIDSAFVDLEDSTPKAVPGFPPGNLSGSGSASLSSLSSSAILSYIRGIYDDSLDRSPDAFTRLLDKADLKPDGRRQSASRTLASPGHELSKGRTPDTRFAKSFAVSFDKDLHAQSAVKLFDLKKKELFIYVDTAVPFLELEEGLLLLLMDRAGGRVDSSKQYAGTNAYYYLALLAKDGTVRYYRIKKDGSGALELIGNYNDLKWESKHR